MSFQEQTDPFIEKIQQAIDGIQTDIHDKEFKNVLGQIDEYFPFVDLVEFVDMYIHGEYSKVLVEKFHLAGQVEYQKLLQILKLPQKRKSIQKTMQSKEINLSNKKLAERYMFLRKILVRFHHIIKDKIVYNVLRAIVLFHLYSNMTNFTRREFIFQSIPDMITNYEHLIFAPHMIISNFSDDEVRKYVESILNELHERDCLEINRLNEFRLRGYHLQIRDYILNAIRNREGITYQNLLINIKKKIPILTQMPPTLFQITLHELISDNQIIKKDGYWKFKPTYDEYFTVKYYRRLVEENLLISSKNKFYGRNITPDEFINELTNLERGDFEDQDDQVTRIAGMILTNSPMMTHPPNALTEFDFVVDLSNYTFTKEQQILIQDLDVQIYSHIVYVKIMIDVNVTIDKLSDLIFKLKNRGSNEQGFIISFAITDDLVNQILEKDKTIQLISKDELKKWCRITPVIPSRRGAVAIVRYGRNKNSIVKIKSINYESGMADVVLLPDMKEDAQYIGSLEEITLNVPIKQFTDCSSKYFEFLRKLRQISKTSVFRSIIADGPIKPSHIKHMPDIEITEHQITCTFYGNSECKIDLNASPNRRKLRYSVDDLFSCTCFAWGHMSKTQGLCEHIIYLLNESVKGILSNNPPLYHIKQKPILAEIERRMDLFLRRLRYANPDGTSATCPNCGCTAHTLELVEKLFGYRQMDKDNKFSLRRQSRCNKCRR